MLIRDPMGDARHDDDTKEPAIDPDRDEALNILGDLVDLTRGAETARPRNP